MPLQITDTAPDFTADTTQGRIRFYDWIGDGWCVLFSHPKDFTPVCTTELGAMAKLKPEFDRRGCKIIGVSVDPVDDHVRWSRDIEETQGQAPNYPMIGDHDLAVAKLYGMLPAGAGETSAGRTPADNATVRNVFVIGPDKKVKLVLVYPMSTGRNFAEILRALDSLQLTAKHQVATPADWRQGGDVIIVPSVSDEAARAKFPGGWRAPQAVPAHRAPARGLTRREAEPGGPGGAGQRGPSPNSSRRNHATGATPTETGRAHDDDTDGRRGPPPGGGGWVQTPGHRAGPGSTPCPRGRCHRHPKGRAAGSRAGLRSVRVLERLRRFELPSGLVVGQGEGREPRQHRLPGHHRRRPSLVDLRQGGQHRLPGAGGGSESAQRSRVDRSPRSDQRVRPPAYGSTFEHAQRSAPHVARTDRRRAAPLSLPGRTDQRERVPL